MKDNIQRRYFVNTDETQLRSLKEDESGKRFIVGYAAKFNIRSKLVFGPRGIFYEEILPGAFDEALRSTNLDTTFNFQHDDNFIIARTLAGTLKLSVDEIGLRYVAEIPDGVSYAEDLYRLVETGNIRDNSFAFFASEDDYEWGEYADDEIPVGKLRNIRKLYDCAAVVRGAFDGTEIETRDLIHRSYDLFLNKETNKNNFEGESRKRKINLI